MVYLSRAALVLTLLSALAGCGAGQSDTTTAAKCAGIRALYDRAQTELIESGACDSVDAITDCSAHGALTEALVITLREARCK